MHIALELSETCLPRRRHLADQRRHPLAKRLGAERPGKIGRAPLRTGDGALKRMHQLRREPLHALVPEISVFRLNTNLAWYVVSAVGVVSVR